MLLRHFDVFRNLVSQENSPSDQAGVISEVASVIRKFTEPVSQNGDKYSDEQSNGDFVSGSYLVVEHVYCLAIFCVLPLFYIKLFANTCSFTMFTSTEAMMRK